MVTFFPILSLPACFHPARAFPHIPESCAKDTTSSQVSSGIENLQINPVELTEVFSHDDPQVEYGLPLSLPPFFLPAIKHIANHFASSIVLVHGLNGSPKDTWTAPNGVFWPSQLLPNNLGKVRARVLVYGYNANVYAFGGGSASGDYILQHAQTFITSLCSDRLVSSDHLIFQPDTADWNVRP